MSNIIYESSRGRDLIPINDVMLADGNVFISGSICRENCNEIIKQLMYLDKNADVQSISIYIDSNGGDVQSGLALYDFIRMLEKSTKTIILGQACSMAAVLFLAADERLMLPDSRVMIHDPSFGGEHDISGKKPHEIQQELDDLNKCRTKLAEIISDRTGKSLKDVYKATKDDSFMDYKQACEFGICTGIYELNGRG